MNKSQKISSIILTSILLVVAGIFGSTKSNPIVGGATVFLPYQGGTGTGTNPKGGQLLIGTNSNVYTPAYLTAGNNITIASSSGGITITAAGSSGGGAAIGLREGYTGAFNDKSSISFNDLAFNLDTSNPDARLNIDYANGPASRSIAQNITGQWRFSSNPLGFTVDNSASVSKNLEVSQLASISTGFVTNYIDWNGNLNMPNAPPANDLRIHAFITHGITRLMQMDESAFSPVIGRDNMFVARNSTASIITKGQVVYTSGSTGNVPDVALAKADSLTTMVSIGIAAEDIQVNGYGLIMVVGILDSFNTNAFPANSRLYVSETTAGAMTKTRPPYPYFTQSLGEVLVQGVGNGSALIHVAATTGDQEAGTTSTTYTFAGSASVSTNFEVAGIASASSTLGSGLTGCTSAGNVLQWLSGLFSCHTLVSGDIPALSYENPLTFSYPLTRSVNTISVANYAGWNIPFLTIGNTASLSFERALAVDTNNFTLTDGGANASATIGLATGLTIPKTASVSQWNTLQHNGPYLPLTGGTLTGSLFGTTASFSNIEITNTASMSFGHVTNYIDIQAMAAQPASPPAGTARVHTLTTQGFTRLEADNECGYDNIISRDNYFIGKNTSGGDFSAGQAVYVTGSTGSVPNMALAKADSATTMPAVAVAEGAVLNNAFGCFMKLGILNSVNTNAFSTGDQIYLATASAGAFTNTRPKNPFFVQRIGSILNKGIGNGSVLVDIAPFIGNRETGTNQTNYLFAGAASVSTNFEVLGFASVSGVFTQHSVASNSFLGSLSGPTTGTLSVGTSDNPLKILWSNIIEAVVSFFFPSYTGTSLTGTGSAAVKTASGSLDFNDGSVTKVLDGNTCFTYYIESPTSGNPLSIGHKAFWNPFTISYVESYASGSNAVGWNLQYGARGAVTTNVFSTAHSASSSVEGKYTTFAASTISDGNILDVRITSASAVLQSFSVNVCGRYTH